MCVAIFILCCVAGVAIFRLIRPLLPIERDDIRTSRKYMPGVYPHEEKRR
jgi:hypothetical protein